MSFSDLGLSDKVLEAVTAAGYTSPTPIQAQAIPHALARRDVLGIAQTGTGKTAAFTLPMLNLLEAGRARARMPRTLILEPTRELAAQVEESFTKLGVNHKLSVALLIGGVSFADQDAKITRGADVLIATPGRLLDHFERGKLLLTGIEVLVIDEADRMLDMGFIPDIERICKMVPFTRQTLFFSATMPPEIQRLTDTFLHNPVKVEVARPSSTANTITQRLVASGAESYKKRKVLRELIRNAQDLQNAIIFCNRKRDVAGLYRSLERHGFNVVALHGDMDQMSRTQALDKFRNGGATLLVASDVAARGLDIPEVSHVYNFDIPIHAEDYVHRIGRTGRAGRAGYAASIVTSNDTKALAAIEELSGTPIEWQGATLEELLKENPDLDQPEPQHDRRRGQSHRNRGETHDQRGTHLARNAPRHGASERDQEQTDNEASRRGHHPHPRAALQPVRVGERHQHSRYRRDDDDLPVVGFGNHIPAFLLREVKISALTSDNDFAFDEDNLEVVDDIENDEIEHQEAQAIEGQAIEATERPNKDNGRKQHRKVRNIEIKVADQPQKAEEDVIVTETVTTETAPITATEAVVEQISDDAGMPSEDTAPKEKARKPARRTTKKAATPVETDAESTEKTDVNVEEPVKPRRKVAAKKTKTETEASAEPAAEAPVKRTTRTRKPATTVTAEGEVKPVKKASPRKKVTAVEEAGDASVIKKPATRKPRKTAAKAATIEVEVEAGVGTEAEVQAADV